MIRTVTSSQGGVFSILVDDFNTTAVIDTYSGPDQPLPPLLSHAISAIYCTASDAGFAEQSHYKIGLYGTFAECAKQFDG